MSFQGDAGNNYEVFRECVSSAIVQKSEVATKTSSKKKKPKSKRRDDGSAKKDAISSEPQDEGIEKPKPEELAEFIDFIASEIFYALPAEIQTLSFSKIQSEPSLGNKYQEPSPSVLESLTAAIPVSVSESLSVYGMIPEPLDLASNFLRPIITDYIASVTMGPPSWASTRTDACEICDRDWIPLSYHHLIPREVHAKVLKRGWHEEWMLNSVAWLCRACHSFVHRMASNEELAREYYTVERILERDDVQDWAKWVRRVRWKAQ